MNIIINYIPKKLFWLLKFKKLLIAISVSIVICCALIIFYKYVYERDISLPTKNAPLNEKLYQKISKKLKIKEEKRNKALQKTYPDIFK